MKVKWFALLLLAALVAAPISAAPDREAPAGPGWLQMLAGWWAGWPTSPVETAWVVAGWLAVDAPAPVPPPETPTTLSVPCGDGGASIDPDGRCRP